MDWSDNEEHARFRAEVRAFIRERFPNDYPPDPSGPVSLEPDDVHGYNWPADRLSPDPVRRRAAMAWAEALAERGWAAPHWPLEYGGAGLTEMEEFILAQEMARAGVPPVNGIGVGLLGPTLIVHGTEDQRLEHLPKILSGDVVWAQGFSEPGAGSDLAGLQTRAQRDGDEYIVNGQKIWTSAAQYADWLFALVRTDPEASVKHRGLSFLLMDLSTPGITVTPITDMGGEQPFNEIFFEDVRVPVRNRVGEENRGWYVAMTLLDFERSAIGGVVRFQRTVAELTTFVRQADGNGTVRSTARGELRQEIAQRAIEVEVAYQFALRTVSVQASGQVPSYEGTINKLFLSELYQRLAATRLKAVGLYGHLWDREVAPMDANASRGYIEAAPQTLMSGSSEVLRNVVATRGLGLPRA